MEKSLKRVSRFGKIMGVLMMVFGGISALSGLTTIVGAIPGVISVWLGYLLFQSGKEADVYLTEPSQKNKDNIIIGFSKFLFISAVLMIVGLVLIIPVTFFIATMSVTM